MNKKLSDLLSQIEPDLLEGIAIEEEEEAKNISISRIKQLAMGSINKEVEQKDEGKGHLESNSVVKKDTKKVIKRSFLRRILPLVAALSLLGIAIAAGTYNMTLRTIFGNLFPFEEQLQSINKTQTLNGLIFTADGAFADNKNGLFIASFEKEDGSSFEEGTAVKSLELVTQRGGSKGWSVNNQLSEDKKKLICVLDLSYEHNLHDQILGLKATDLWVWKHLETQSKLPLDQLIKEKASQPLTIDFIGDTKEKGLNQPFIDYFKELTIDRAALSDKGLELMTSYKDLEGITDRTIGLYIVDQRTQQEFEANPYIGQWVEGEELNKSYFLFNNVTLEDLPYLKLKLEDFHHQDLLSGQWQVDFKLEKNTEVKTKRVNQTIKTDYQTLVIRKLEVSALGVTIEGKKLTTYSEPLENMYLKMKDGSQVALTSTGMSSGFWGLKMHTKPEPRGEAGDGTPEVSGIESVTDSKLDFGLANFIDIEQVEGVVIEGVSFEFD